MKLFTCPACQQPLHFENSQCTRCGHVLAFVPEHAMLTAVEPVADSPGLFRALRLKDEGARYRACGNWVDHQACNGTVLEGDDQRFCLACRLNEIIPNLADPAAMEAWLKLERSKRRLILRRDSVEIMIQRWGPAGLIRPAGDWHVYVRTTGVRELHRQPGRRNLESGPQRTARPGDPRVPDQPRRRRAAHRRAGQRIVQAGRQQQDRGGPRPQPAHGGPLHPREEVIAETFDTWSCVGRVLIVRAGATRPTTISVREAA